MFPFLASCMWNDEHQMCKAVMNSFLPPKKHTFSFSKFLLLEVLALIVFSKSQFTR